MVARAAASRPAAPTRPPETAMLSVFHKLFPRPRTVTRRPEPAARRTRLGLLALEDRLVPAAPTDGCRWAARR